MTWLRGEAPCRLVPVLSRFANGRPRWTVADVVTHLDTVNARLSWSAIDRERIRTRPAAVLARYLRDADPQADHPRPDIRTAADAAPAWCGACERRTRSVELDDGRTRRCPRCHPHAAR